MKTEERSDNKKMTEEKGECRDRVSGEGNVALPTSSSTSVNEHSGGESTTHTLEKRKTGCEEKINKRIRLEDT